MKLTKCLSTICAGVLVAMSLSSCSLGDIGKKKEEKGIIDFKASEKNVKYIGRTHYENDLLLCAFSGTGIEFTFNGKKAEITILGDSASKTPSNVDNFARVAIYVDGERVVDEMINEEEKTFTAFESETEKDVTIRVVKLSETAMSTFAIKNIKLDTTNGIKPTEKKEKLIEFVGDSITCGYGVDDENKDNHFSTKTEDATKTYAYKTAQALNMDYSLVSISGYGVISGYTSPNAGKKAEQTIPQYYDKIGFSYGNLNGVQPSSLKWDFTKRSPDYIVINLGTNDDSYCQNDEAKQAEYVAGYVDFLKQIRAVNPNSKIICTLGIMGDRLFPSIETAVEKFKTETGDNNVYTMAFTPQIAEDGYAADWHPTEATHKKASDKLIAQIESLS